MTTSKLWKPIQNYIDQLNVGAMPALHHYTSVNGALGILNSGRFWFTERAHLNDPSEVSYGLDIALGELRSRKRDSHADRLESKAKMVFRDFRFFSASLTFERDDLSQWRNYADAGKGVAISFKASAFNYPVKLIKNTILENSNIFVCPMSYDSSKLGEVISAIIDLWDEKNISELSDHIFMISSLFKENFWKCENEFRFFIHGHRDNVLKSEYCKFRERNGEIVSYLDLPIQNWDSAAEFPIFQITLGPMTKPELKRQLEDLLFSKGIRIPIELSRF